MKEHAATIGSIGHLPAPSHGIRPSLAGFWRKLLAFGGPGYLVAVGYMDPGNWATDLAGGSAFGYVLLSVVLMSSMMAMLLQYLSAKLGIATGRDLAQLCREHFSPRVAVALWALCELAIVACDLAELLGTAIALKLLFGISLGWGVGIAAVGTLVVLGLLQERARGLEILIIGLLVVIAGCFAAELIFAQPVLSEVLSGLVPQTRIVSDPTMLYVAVGIIGATVMPHNLYLHSAIVQAKPFSRTATGRREAIRFAGIDSTIALTLALLINAAILILAAATFHSQGRMEIAGLEEAHHLLSPMLGAPLAGTLFALALLAAGQNSSVTGTLAGQIVMEGFLSIRLPVWLRRIATRLAAIVPVLVTMALFGEQATDKLLVLSQVVLSLQLPFAVIPLVYFTGDKRRMGPFANARWLAAAAWIVAAVIVGLNIWLLAYTIL
ncbi:MAG TPA: Nramp family divalent metal transporter [Dongiaceae bacterium]|jgi:manganese transport protein|nr:Nramp family divalent metal transporter [Dongiaceae bacterium]